MTGTNGVGAAHSLTGIQAQYGSFKKVPKEFVEELGESKSKKLTQYVKELSKGNDDNIDELIDLLEEAEGEIPDKELMTLINEINDFIVTNPQSESSKSKLKIQKEFQDKIVGSSSLGDLLDKVEDPKNATGDSLSAFIKDFQTERLETLIALNKDELADELDKIKNGESTDQNKLKELIAVAGELYDSDSDKAQMINDVLSGFKGFDYNVKSINNGKVSEVEEHEYTHRGGAAGSNGEIATRVSEWVEVESTSSDDDDDDDNDDNDSSDNSSMNDFLSGLDEFRSRQRSQIDRLPERLTRSRERSAASNYPGQYLRTPHGLYTSGSLGGYSNPIFSALSNGVNDVMNLYGQVHDAGRLFNGASSAVNVGPGGTWYETIADPYSNGYGGIGYPPYPVPDYDDYYGSGGSQQINFNPVISIDNTSSAGAYSQSNPIVSNYNPVSVNTNTPVNTNVPSTFSPSISGYNSNAQFPFVYS